MNDYTVTLVIDVYADMRVSASSDAVARKAAVGFAERVLRQHFQDVKIYEDSIYVPTPPDYCRKED